MKKKTRKKIPLSYAEEMGSLSGGRTITNKLKPIVGWCVYLGESFIDFRTTRNSAVGLARLLRIQGSKNVKVIKVRITEVEK